jgi:hypothetical protein
MEGDYKVKCLITERHPASVSQHRGPVDNHRTVTMFGIKVALEQYVRCRMRTATGTDVKDKIRTLDWQGDLPQGPRDSIKTP